MALRVVHLLALGALSITIYVYASYYNAGGGPAIRQHIAHAAFLVVDRNATSQPDASDSSKQQQQQQVANVSSSSVPSVPSPDSNPPGSSAATIPPTNSTAKSHQPDLSRGIKSNIIYIAGHAVPRPEICPDLGASLRLLIIIMSAPAHFDARMAIRQTWGHYASRKDVAVAFMLGATNDEKLEANLTVEGTLYEDIIRGHFYDSYNNLTLKTISTMEWVSDYCSNAKFFLKTDDDMFINVPRLLAFVDKHINDRKVIFGRLAKRWKPIRNPKSKYYVSVHQYRAPIFPDFTTGPAYLLAATLAGDLYKGSLEQTYLKLEDVFTTGVVAQKLHIRRSHAAEFLNKRVPMNACTAQRAISIHMVKFSEQFDLWKKLLDGKTKCK